MVGTPERQPLAWAEGEFAQLITFDRVPEGRDVFLNHRFQANLGGALFGGMVLAQAVHCTQSTADTMRVHTVQAEFLRSGATDLPVRYQVERTRDGRRFANRRIDATQAGRTIFHAQISLAARSEGFVWSPPMPEVPPPETLQSAADLLRLHDHVLDRRGRLRLQGFPAIEARFVQPERFLFGGAGEPRYEIWVRMPGTAGLAPVGHQSAIAYLSDWLLASVFRAAMPSEVADMITAMASLNHTLWLHEPVRADAWLLFAMECLWCGENRTLCRGQLYSRDGRLAATIMQEAMTESAPV